MQRVVASFLILVVIPLCGVVAAFNWLILGKPVLFFQQRSGLHGKPFTMVKFRSMRDDRDAGGILLPDEQRVTAWGTFLRRSRLDELPGLWSIARGDMAIVGPRPLLPETIASLGECGRKRSEVLPGLTGWAQVNGNTLLTLDEKVALDLWYVEHASVRLDLAIIFRTVLVVIGGEKRTATTTTAERMNKKSG